MRILYTLTDADIGGAERFLVTLARHKAAGDTVGLIVLMAPGSLSVDIDDAFDWVNYLGFPPSSRNLMGMVRAFDRAAREFRPDVISSHLFHTDLVVLLSRIRVPKTTTLHTQGFGSGDHPLTKLIARVVGALSGRFDAVIAASSSSAMAEFARRRTYKEFAALIPNAADLPAAPVFSPTSREFISIARNHPVKGHPVLFQAAAQVLREFPDWTLTCYGPDVDTSDPAMLQAIERAGAADLLEQGRIRLEGATNEPVQALAMASGLVISSTYGEAFPIVGVEAAGAGVPVITTDVGSCAEFVDDARFLVEPDNADALAGALRAFAALDHEERAVLSRKARERAERDYSPERAVRQYGELFARLIAAHEQRAGLKR